MDRQKKKKVKYTIPKTVEIDRQQHALMILRRFQEMQQEGVACDFTVKVNGRGIAVHRDILCGGSQYFRTLLWHDAREFKRVDLEMLGVDYDCVRLCVDFIYGREVHVNPEQYEDLMFVAHLMQLKTLCKAIEQSMMDHMTTKTLLQYKNAAIFYGCPKLLVKCERYARIYFEDLSRVDDFKEIDKDSLLCLLKSKRSKMDEDDKLTVTLRWVRSEPARSSQLMFLLDAIDLMRIPLTRLQRLVEVEDLIIGNPDCLEKFNETIENYVEKLPEDENYWMKNFMIFPRNSEKLQLFDPRTSELTEIKAGKCKILVDYSAIIFENHVYVLADDKSMHKLCYWDEVAQWEKLPDMKEKHGMFPPTAISARKFYVVGAFGQGYSSDAVERYHPDYKEWESLPKKPTKSDGAQLVSINGSIFAVGGSVDGKSTKEVFKYDTDLFEWFSLSPMSEARSGHSVVQWGGNIIVAGGQSQWRKHKSVEHYKTDTDQWTVLPSMKLERTVFNLLPSDGFLYAVGGIGRKQAASVIEVYDFDKEEWKLIKMSRDTAPKVYQAVAVEVDEI